jgi:signal transduction histidine kinase
MINLRIGTRLVGGFVALAGLIVAVGLVALSGLRDVTAHDQEALAAYRGGAVVGLQLETAILEQTRLQKNFLLRGEPAYLAEARDAAKRVRAARARLDGIEAIEADRDLLARLDRGLDDLDASFQRTIAVRRTEGVLAADAVIRGKAARLVDILDELVQRAQVRAEQAREHALAEARQTERLTIGLIVFVGLLGLWLGLALSLSVTRPLRRLQTQIDAVARGEPKPAAPAVEGRDEVAQIARAFHELVQKAALLRETEARSKRLEALSSRVARAQEEEREHIAHELHDGLGQALTAIKLDLAAAARTMKPEMASAAEHLAKAQRLADESLDELRRLASDLRPAALDNLGLVAALESYARGFKDRAGVAAIVEADKLEPRLPFEVETALYRICQEALTNIAKHAQAQRAVVRLQRESESVRLTVTDDGTGFDTSAVTTTDGTLKGIGLLSMERRAEELGGKFSIDSAPGQGTTVVVTVPWNPERRA